MRLKIRGGEWSDGAMLPSRRTLAKEYGVSSLTIDRAVTSLITEGLLRADDRRGTFVTKSGAENAMVPVAPRTPAAKDFGIAFGSASLLSRTNPHSVIGVICPVYVYSNDHHDLHNFWARLLLQLLEHDLSQAGKTTHFFNQVKAPGQPIVPLSEMIAETRATGVNALVVVGMPTGEPEEIGSQIAASENGEMPVVCITTGPISRPIPHIFYDSRSAGYDAAHHLIERGYKNLIYFAPFQAVWVAQRREGIQTAVNHAENVTLRVLPQYTLQWEVDEDPEVSGYNAAGAVLDRGIAGAGVICCNDGVAVGLLRAAKERGLTPGKDFGLVGFDDRQDARNLGLTTMRPPMEAIGRETARLLLGAMRGEKTDLQVRLRSHLISRRSSLFAGV